MNAMQKDNKNISTSDIPSTKIKVLQANIHHAKAASGTFVHRFASEGLSIGLIQEPWVLRGAIKGLSHRG